MKSKNLYKVLFVSSMAIFGTIALFVRGVALPSEEIALYRAILAAILLGAFLLITKQRIEIVDIKKQLPLLLFSGVAMGINWIFLFEAYNYTTVSAATLSYYFAPILVTIVSPLLFKEKLTPKQIICFLMSTVGIVLITGIGDFKADGANFIGILFGLLAAAFYATVILINKFIKGIDGISRTFLQFLAAIIILLPYVLLGDGINLGTLTPSGWISLLIVGIIHTGITYCMYFSSLKELDGGNVAILSYIDPLVAVLLSVFVLHENMNAWQWLGGALILGFTLWNEIPSKKK